MNEDSMTYAYLWSKFCIIESKIDKYKFIIEVVCDKYSCRTMCDRRQMLIDMKYK